MVKIMKLATKTIEAITKSMEADQGASFRILLGQIIPTTTDAYRGKEFPFRSHMGSSGIGQECARKIWYSFRWFSLEKFSCRILRLFNRGHLEEARFVALLMSIGVTVYSVDSNGKQFHISDAGGHFGGSIDGVGIGIPDLPEGTPCLLEFKTSGEKPFNRLKKLGLRDEKFQHYVQMQVYMRKLRLNSGLYMVVNKNTDELYAEIVDLDVETADRFVERGVELVFADTPPSRISETPAWIECKWCTYNDICHTKGTPHRNCRTCTSSRPLKDGTWACLNPHSPSNGTITTAQQWDGCTCYEREF